MPRRRTPALSEAELVRRFVFDPLPRQRSMLVANEREPGQLDPVSADRT